MKTTILILFMALFSNGCSTIINNREYPMHSNPICPPIHSVYILDLILASSILTFGILIQNKIIPTDNPEYLEKNNINYIALPLFMTSVIFFMSSYMGIAEVFDCANNGERHI